MSVGAVCASSVPRSDPSPLVALTNPKSQLIWSDLIWSDLIWSDLIWFDFVLRGDVLGGEAELTLGLSMNVRKNNDNKNYVSTYRYNMTAKLNPWLSTSVHIVHSSLPCVGGWHLIHRDSSFPYSRNSAYQHYRGICLCENGFRVSAGRVWAGTGFRFFRGTTGYGISHFSRNQLKTSNPVQCRGT